MFPAAAQNEPRTLQGEDLFVQVEGVTMTADCHPDAVSTVHYTATGPATGPYPGTFVVSGTVTIGPHTVEGQHPPNPPVSEGTLAGPVLTLEETFTIYSGATTINGTKTLSPDASFPDNGQGTCQHVSQFPVLDFVDGAGTVVEIAAPTRYEATIHEVAGTFTDSGDSVTVPSEIDITGSCPAGPDCHARIGGFAETFLVSDQLASTPGHANGGGQISSPSGSGQVTFAFHAQNDAAGMKGGCNVDDLMARRHVQCLTVTSYVQDGSHMTIRGAATDNGLPTQYLIEADDNGEPGHEGDTFSIATGTGYRAGGPITNGNVQVR